MVSMTEGDTPATTGGDPASQVYPCPACGAEANLASGCAGCHRPPDPQAAQVIALNRHIYGLTGEVDAAHRAYTAAVLRLQQVRRQRDALVTAIRGRAL